ncbi:HNH endonuclease [Microbacterium lacus]|uniref:HNH endonuclease signature motif containing protein n=1 Tax=Microbacterium lacus TaxID=415217 RepID=UPI00384C2AA1
MATLLTLLEHFETRCGRSLLDVEVADLPSVLRASDTDAVVEGVAEASRVINALQCLVAVGAGVIAERSTRDLGHTGAAAVRGHRTAVDLVQSVSGGTRADAVRAVRVGESLVQGVVDESSVADAATLTSSEPMRSWFAVVSDALLRGTLTTAQHDAIRRGLGEPPVPVGGSEPDSEAVEAWGIAGEQLIRLAGEVAVEELGRAARQMRDSLDAVGAEERHQRRYLGRSFRTWVDADGVRRITIVCDDEGGEWVASVEASALRPRRGGPRFVDSAEVAAASALASDPRTNEQLAYDLVMGMFMAGALAEASAVFGARQPGVRMVIVKDLVGPRDHFGRLLAVGHYDDGGNAIAGSQIDRALCNTGYRDITVDAGGNPLDVGRELRLYSTSQRIALAARDGGCMWTGCRVPASYCEAHHIDHWCEHNGRTDIDRGILLCRFHHMALHNQGFRITREGKGAFVLEPPPDSPVSSVILASKSAIAWAWDPPPPTPPDALSRVGWRNSQESLATAS